MDNVLNMNGNCYCGNDMPYQKCCMIIHDNYKNADSAEQLMRARYSAFVLHMVDFLYETFHPTSRRFQKKAEIEQWSKENQWIGLDVIKATENTVEFRAFYLDSAGNDFNHHEKSRFQKLHGTWYYLDGKVLA